jgi:hypothetical protein
LILKRIQARNSAIHKELLAVAEWNWQRQKLGEVLCRTGLTKGRTRVFNNCRESRPNSISYNGEADEKTIREMCG